jgi:hypothetical protein
MCILSYISVFAVIPVVIFCGVAADISGCNFENKKVFFFLGTCTCNLLEWVCLCRKVDRLNVEFVFDITNTLFGFG